MKAAGLLDACGHIITGHSAEDSLLRALRASVHLCDADAGFILLFDKEDKDSLICAAAYAPDGQFDFPSSLRLNEGLAGACTTAGREIRLTTDATGAVGELDPRTKSAIAMPLMADMRPGGGSRPERRILGVLELISFKSASAFQEGGLDQVRALASMISLAVAYQHLEVFQQKTLVEVMRRLCAALEDKDPYAAGHSVRAGELAQMIGQSLGLPQEELDELTLGMALHDIGKVAVPDSILHKTSQLTPEEFEMMATHTLVGYQICQPLMLSPTVLMIIRSHHEKLDGTGYPDKLRGDELPLAVRIAGVAIAFDAMKSPRAWRPALTPGETISELTKTAGRQYDPLVVQTLRQLIDSGAYYSIYPEDAPQTYMEAA